MFKAFGYVPYALGYYDEPAFWNALPLRLDGCNEYMARERKGPLEYDRSA